MTAPLEQQGHRLGVQVKAAFCGLLVMCLMQSACTNPRQPDLGSLESPGGSDSCARQVSVGGGIVHVLAVIGPDETSSACDVSATALRPLSSTPAAELPQEIRGTMRCSLIGQAGGTNPGRVYKVYVFADGAADAAARKVCDQLRAGADPSFDFQSS